MRKVWDKQAVIELLERNNVAVVRAILALYERQTEDEKAAKETKQHNGRGFNSIDANFLSDIAVKLPKYDYKMTERQLKTARKMLRKYAGQLVQIIQEKAGATVQVAPAVQTPEGYGEF